MKFLVPRTAAVAMVVAIAAGNVHGQAAEPVERFTAIAVNTGEFGRPATGLLEIVVNQWTGQDESDMLLGLLVEEGAGSMLAELREARRAGFIRTPVGLTYSIHIARMGVYPDGSRRVVLVTERPVSFWEASSGPLPIDYPLAIIDLQLEPNGQGTGTMVIGTRTAADREPDNEGEEYLVRPIQLLQVRSSNER